MKTKQRKKSPAATAERAKARSLEREVRPHLWRIKIWDGYAEYEYMLPSTHGEFSIDDIYETIREKLQAPRMRGVYLSAV